ncbi:MAG: CBS domain-containing protein [Candidatus Binatia bacterium]|jgi:CBS domain-containing protein|nr:CBS domain-containing protein [Candidatus Binatia bacterium]
MTADPVSVNISAPIGEVLSRMYEGDFRNMPVLGYAGNLGGVVSMGDVLKYT